MKAYTYHKPHQFSEFQIEITEVANPVLRPQDLLVRVKAFSFNPVDYKIRESRKSVDGKPVILGWDAAGIVEKIGSDAKGFNVGDEVFYAGDLTRDGSYAELQAVDSRLIAKKPRSLNFTEAAALPLTALTAWEALLERGIEYGANTKVLVVGGAGGVGSMAIQLLKAKTSATVIATASRPETVEWCKRMGADHVIGRNIEAELLALGIDDVDVIFGTTHTEQYLPVYQKILRPFGHLCLIDDPETLDIRPFKSKAISVHWEFMFTKSMYAYAESSQGNILNQLSTLIDAGEVRTTLTKVVTSNIEGIREAHQLLESGSSIGKIVMEI